MINSCKRYLSCNGTKSVWEQPEDVVKRKISACIELNEEYQTCFQRVKDETEVPQTREFHFCEVFVFGKFDAFCNRLKKLLKLFDCVQIHDNIISYQQEEDFGKQTMPGKRSRRHFSQLSEFERSLIIGMKTAGW
ncbi:dynein heavy chain 5, axonemal [Trichonephila clavipes]|nr:dynein heavy chain 5, axonemal [Trichonephila clavipes]